MVAVSGYAGEHTMALSNEQKSKLLLDTKDAAWAFLEDMEHMRETIARHITSRGELRRMALFSLKTLMLGNAS
jgi:hypothetical protein